MSAVGWRVSCFDCGGELGVVNEGAVFDRTAHAVHGCVSCGAEWSFRLDAARVRLGRPAEGRRSSREDVDAAMGHAAWMVDVKGVGPVEACRTVGLDRFTFAARRRKEMAS